jgi:manganese/iron transport system permease protein
MNLWLLVVMAAILGGASAGVLGVWITGLRMPFLAVFAAHAALAGAVLGAHIGLEPQLAGFIGALAGAGLLGWLLRKRDLDPNAALGALFSLALGVAFLGIGLAPEGQKPAVLQMLWGNLLLVTETQVALMALTAALFFAFAFAFNKELKVLLFSRPLAATMVPAGLVFGALLVLAAGVITVNMQAVGGLLLYSLICNPAMAALKVARTYRGVLIGGGILGALSALGGFAAAYVLNWPVGACIVLCSSLILGLATLAGRISAGPRINTSGGQDAEH